MAFTSKTIVYHDADVELERIRKRRVAIIGYGAQGRAQALNLRDNDVDVIVGARKASDNKKIADEDGFSTFSIEEATAQADIISLLTPDETHSEVFEDFIYGSIQPGATLLFSHGASVHFKAIVPPKNVDVILVAPMGPGAEMRRLYKNGSGLNAKIAVNNDVSGEAWMIALAYAGALGCGRAGIVVTTFAEETELDMFSEQAVLCGSIPAIAQATCEILIDAGYPPEIAYIECVREIKHIADLMFEYGLQGMRERVSTTALYGGVTRGERIVSDKTKKELRKILAEIRTGDFAAEISKYKEIREDMYNRVRNEKVENAQKQFEKVFEKPKIEE